MTVHNTERCRFLLFKKKKNSQNKYAKKTHEEQSQKAARAKKHRTVFKKPKTSSGM